MFELRNYYVRNRDNPNVRALQKPNVIQKWLEDNGKAAGDLKKPGANFDNLDLHGKAFGNKVKPFNFQFKIKKTITKTP